MSRTVGTVGTDLSGQTVRQMTTTYRDSSPIRAVPSPIGGLSDTKCNQSKKLSREVRDKSVRRRALRKAERQTEPWPPLEFCLPNLDTLEELSRGGPVVQKSLQFDLPDDSRAGRVSRLLGECGLEPTLMQQGLR